MPSGERGVRGCGSGAVGVGEGGGGAHGCELRRGAGKAGGLPRRSGTGTAFGGGGGGGRPAFMGQESWRPLDGALQNDTNLHKSWAKAVQICCATVCGVAGVGPPGGSPRQIQRHALDGGRLLKRGREQLGPGGRSPSCRSGSDGGCPALQRREGPRAVVRDSVGGEIEVEGVQRRGVLQGRERLHTAVPDFIA